MAEPGADAVCRRICADLVADRGPLAITGEAAMALRHLLREQGLSGLAAVAIDVEQLQVPAMVREGIRRDWASAMHQSLLLDAECGRLGRLAGRNVAAGRPLSPPLLMKGAAVGRRYANPSTRTYVDIDLLVSPQEVPAWARVLNDAGYWAPKPEIRAVAQRLREGAEFVREDDGGQMSVDLHSSVFIERRAREVDYAAFASCMERSEFSGLLWLQPHAQLVVLALHLAHHGAADHRFIWFRDFIEIADPPTVVAARAFAVGHDVLWALERALLAVEAVLRRPQWNARSIPDGGFGLASVHQLGRPEYLRHVALVRELGLVAGARYFASRLDPRRFARPGGGFDRSAARAWLSHAAVRATSTPWSRCRRRG